MVAQLGGEPGSQAKPPQDWVEPVPLQEPALQVFFTRAVPSLLQTRSQSSPSFFAQRPAEHLPVFPQLPELATGEQPLSLVPSETAEQVPGLPDELQV
jgi:hypothetical protein